eukprot:1053639-Karenia_brevis.AAC.1
MSMQLQQQQQQLQQRDHIIEQLQSEVKSLQTQCGHLTDLLGGTFNVPSHASPVLFDLFDDDDKN